MRARHMTKHDLMSIIAFAMEQTPHPKVDDVTVDDVEVNGHATSEVTVTTIDGYTGERQKWIVTIDGIIETDLELV